MQKLISQGFILVGYCIFIFSRVCKNKDKILLTDNISRATLLIGYILFGSINGIENAVYSILRNIIGKMLEQKSKTFQMIEFVVMSILLIVMYSLSFDGVPTVMFILFGLINLFAVVFLNAQGIRLGTVLATICAMIAYLLIGSYASVAGEVLCGFVATASYLKGRKRDRQDALPIEKYAVPQEKREDALE